MSLVLNIVIAMLGTALILAVGRLLRGPTLPDRVVALDLISSLVVGIIVAYAVATDQAVYLRDAIVLAVISFLGTVAFAYYVAKGGRP
ncbi:MAG: cation:proton antiporter [Candidatus Hydrogenedentes bacterium]|nr:cation:proton antiporter [Candidatus Hydrogenedentota bacterium]